MLIESKTLEVDFNGIVIFSYIGLIEAYGKPLVEGENILKDFTETDMGDRVTDAGIVVPIINIDDGQYLIRFFSEERIVDDKRTKTLFTDNGYCLDARSQIYIADAAVFWDWEEYLGWQKVDIEKSYYGVAISGVQHLDDTGVCVAVGYDIVLRKTHTLPARTATIREDSRVPWTKLTN